MPQVDIVSRSGERIPVSVWMKRVKQESSLCCVVMLEPVERVSAWVAFRSDVSHVQVPSCGSPYPLGASPPRRVSTWCPPGPWGRKRAWGLGGCAWGPPGSCAWAGHPTSLASVPPPMLVGYEPGPPQDDLNTWIKSYVCPLGGG